MTTKITQTELKELFDYDPATGNFIRRIASQPAREDAGDVAKGRVDKNGYRMIFVKGRSYPHRSLVWLWHHGTFSKHRLTAKNGDLLDCRIENIKQLGADSTANPDEYAPQQHLADLSEHLAFLHRTCLIKGLSAAETIRHLREYAREFLDHHNQEEQASQEEKPSQKKERQVKARVAKPTKNCNDKPTHQRPTFAFEHDEAIASPQDELIFVDRDTGRIVATVHTNESGSAYAFDPEGFDDE